MKRRHHKSVKPGQGRKVSDRCGVTGKARYKNLGVAAEALRRIRLQVAEQHDTKHQERRAYKCRFCGGAHLSSGMGSSEFLPPSKEAS